MSGRERLLERAREHWKGNLVFIKWESPKHGAHQFMAGCAALGDDARCTIYENRPGACRSYDCREDTKWRTNEESPQCAWPRQ